MFNVSTYMRAICFAACAVTLTCMHRMMIAVVKASLVNCSFLLTGKVSSYNILSLNIIRYTCFHIVIIHVVC